jgi:hypothetical protein
MIKDKIQDKTRNRFTEAHSPIIGVERVERRRFDLHPQLIEGEIEPCFTVAYIASQLTLSTDTIRRLFECENGVLRIGNPSRRVGRKLKRAYFTLRIPQSVFLRVRDRMAQKRSR